ncbi:zinc ribbon domain-containing protein [Acetoanaerobium noterae]|uniref:zinc ribbon domain-containing protein n=1 Tax=Acetoanaerobium noterae TaxID=745369 RepID=UPI0028B106D6|nr:zinc ribbon domain-containing protein [Acetoanaerobium noterae]
MKFILYIILSIIIYLIVNKEGKLHAEDGKREKCSNCGEIINSNFLFCPYCKEEIKKVCDSCNRLIDIDWRYCPFCENNEQNTKMIKIRPASNSQGK